MSTGIGISVITIWTLIYKLPYLWLMKDAFSISITVFTLTAGLLSIPCFWIAWISHYSKGNYILLSLLMILSGFCLLMHAIGGSLGMVYKTYMQFDMKTLSPKLLPGQYQKQLNETMLQMLHSETLEATWNKIQNRLGCCGVTKYTDWYSINKTIPPSCCADIKCHKIQVNTSGCLDPVAFDLVWEACLLSGLSFIVSIVHVFSICMGCYGYIKQHA